jgi:hypothetical protein
VWGTKQACNGMRNVYKSLYAAPEGKKLESIYINARILLKLVGCFDHGDIFSTS